MRRTFKTTRTKERMPNFNERILFINEGVSSDFMSEYNPDQEIEIKKGKFVQLSNCPRAIEILKTQFTHWLEEVKE